MVLTTPIVLTQTHGIVLVLLNHTRTRGPSVTRMPDILYLFIFGRNQSGCEKTKKKVGFLPSTLWILLAIYICFALMKTTMCFKHLEASHIMP